MRVVVVDDNDVWRSSLVSALVSQGVTVVVEAADGVRLLEWLERLDVLDDPAAGRVDVAILDLRLPPTYSDEGIHLAKLLRMRMAGVGIMILSGYEHDVQLHYATRAFEDLSATGGVGYLFKDRTNRRSLRDAVVRIAEGRVVVDPIFIEQAVEQYHRQQPDGAATDRQADVMALLLSGRVESEIAAELVAERLTVERDLAAISAGVAQDDRVGGHRSDPGGGHVIAILEWLRRSDRTD